MKSADERRRHAAVRGDLYLISKGPEPEGGTGLFDAGDCHSLAGWNGVTLRQRTGDYGLSSYGRGIDHVISGRIRLAVLKGKVDRAVYDGRWWGWSNNVLSARREHQQTDNKEPHFYLRGECLPLDDTMSCLGTPTNRVQVFVSGASQ